MLPRLAAGKETVRRLSDLPGASKLVGVSLGLPDSLSSITTVRQLAQLLKTVGSRTAVSV